MLTDENPKAFLEFVGSSMSLVGLRQELCFVMRIDDSSFANQLTSNYESKAAIHLVDIHELEKEEQMFLMGVDINIDYVLKCK